jgi:phosphoribosylaminoimidazole-succinocarboxamide synthase
MIKINTEMNTNIDSEISSLDKIYSGKVRDLYAIDEKKMLMVASDRLSTFDVILNQAIPRKGCYLTQISLFWFDYLKNIMPNHLINGDNLEIIVANLNPAERAYLDKRSSIVKRVTPLPIEIIVRGYLAGSGYNDYLKTGTVCGIKLPQNLQNAEQLPHPIFTPSTKAKIGDHDENITLEECRQLIGTQLTEEVERLALALYNKAAALALSCGIIIADTKFEFGIDDGGDLILIDEVLTPDSSRFWDVDNYTIGSNPLSFDKQFVRDYLQKDLNWNKEPPIPDLPTEIIEKTVAKYREIAHRLGIKV